MRTLASDIRWSLKLLRRRPAFSATIVLTLAAAIAAVTTTTAMATAVLWRPLPFAAANRLVFVWENTGASGGTEAARVTGFRFTQWERGTRTLSRIAAFGAAGFLADTAGGPTQVNGVRVTTNYFATLGIAPQLGRDFTTADGDPGAAHVVILSHALWIEWFGGRADAVGTSIRLDGGPYTIVGVMPAAVFPGWPVNPAAVTLDAESRRLWVPIARTPALAANVRAHVLGVVGRLADGRSIDDAASELTRLVDPTDPDTHGAALRPFRDQLVRDARLPLIALLGAAFAVLLVAATNLAALQGSAIEGRRAELSVRAALGAGRARLARQLVTEAAMLTTTGAMLGVALSAVALARIPSLLPPSVPLLTPPSVDARTLLVAASVAVFAAAMLAAWPFARTLAATAPAPRGFVPLARSRTFRALVVAQVAFAMALASTAALLQRSLDAVRRQPTGFVVDNVLTATVALPGAAYDGSTDRVVSTERRMADELARLPGARAVAFAYDLPLEAHWIDAYRVSGSTAGRDDTSSSAQLRIVSPSYFDTMRVGVIDGRGFTEHDTYAAAGVAVVNEAFAARLLDGPALNRSLHTGSTLRARRDVQLPSEFRIVGVVENERFRGLESPVEPAVYLSTRQFPQQQVVMLMRTAADPLALAPSVRESLRRIDPGVPVDRMAALSSILAGQLVTRRATTSVISSFAAGALTLAGLGLYGLLALLVASGVRETGIRLALGASPAQEAGRVVKNAVLSAAAGVACGSALSLAGGRLLQSLLVGVTPRDATTLALASGTIAAVAVASAALPALRAARVDPAKALRA